MNVTMEYASGFINAQNSCKNYMSMLELEKGSQLNAAGMNRSNFFRFPAIVNEVELKVFGDRALYSCTPRKIVPIV